MSFDLNLANGQTSIVSGGIPIIPFQFSGANPAFSISQSASSNPIPGDVKTLIFSWSLVGISQAENVTISFNSTQGAPVEWIPNTIVADSIQNNGTFTLEFNCSSGVLSLATTISLLSEDNNNNSSSLSSYTFYLNKDCSSTTDSCNSCGSCYGQQSCECIRGASGSVCSQIVDKKTSDDAFDETKVLSWSLSGSQDQNFDLESPQQISSRHREIASYILSKQYSIVCLQGVWDDTNARQVLFDELRNELPFISTKTFGTGARLNSGFFFATRFPILLQDFEQFTGLAGGIAEDAPFDKGIFGALVQVRPGYLIYVFHTQLQSGIGAQFDAIRSRQLTVAKLHIQNQLRQASSTYSIGSMAVLLLGDLQINGLGGTPQSLLDELGNPKDIFADLNGNDAASQSVTYGGFNLIPQTTSSPTQLPSARYDYAFLYSFFIDSNGNNVSAREPEFISTAVLADHVSSSSQTPFGTEKYLSAHRPLEVVLDTSQSILLEALLPSLAIFIVLVLVALILIQIYIRKKPVPMPAALRPYFRQAGALFKKNWLLTIRDKRAVIIQLLVPFILVFLLWVLQFALEANQARQELTRDIRSQQVTTVPSIQPCIIGQDNTLGRCYTIGYTTTPVSTKPFVDYIISMIASKNNIDSSQVIYFGSQSEANTFLLDNVNSTQGIYHFIPLTLPPNCTANEVQSRTCQLVSLRYTVQYNQSVVFAGRGQTRPSLDTLLPMQTALEQAVFEYRLPVGYTLNYNPSLLQFPHPELANVNVIGTSGPAFFLGCLMFNLVIQLGQIVAEKEFNLRQAMTVVGLKDSVYWFTWVITNLAWNTLSALLLILAGLIFQFDFFLKNDFGTYFFLFVLFGFAMVPFALFFSLFLSQNRTATSLGFALFLVGVIAQAAAAFVFNDSTPEYVQYLLALLPFVLLSKGMSDLGNFSSSESSVGLRWYDRASYGYWPLETTFRWFIIDFFIYLVLTLVIDFCFGGIYGESRARKLFTRLTTKQRDSSKKSEEAELQNIDADVAEEEKLARQGKFDENASIVVKGLTKTFRNYSFGCIHEPKKDFTAVDHLYLHMDSGQLFCLLGHNGAGKSTTISMLTGLLEPSEGDAFILKHSLRQETALVRKSIGVCPQFDILWPELTAGEHIRLFGSLKNMDSDLLQSEVEARLKEVELTHVENTVAGSYSGGMRRRLSVAMALTGSPDIVFLDEPTTGMDPVSRRQVWSLLEKEKSRRMILLTTHSMEEADILGDKIAIMKKGRLECIGTGLRLKSRFGNGIRVTVVTSNDEKAAATIKQHLPSAVVCRESTPHTLHYEVPFADAEQLPTFLNVVDTLDDSGVVDVQVGMTSLEDVFMKVAGLEQEKVDEEHHQTAEEAKEQTGKTSSKKEKEQDNNNVEPYPEVHRSRQFLALFAKNGIAQLRQRKTNLCQILFPLFLILILFGFQQLVTNTFQDQVGETSPAIGNPEQLILPPFLVQTADFDASTDCPPRYTLLQGRPPSTLDLASGRLLIANPSNWAGLGTYGAQVATNQFWSADTSLLLAPSGFLGSLSRNGADYNAIKGNVNILQGNRQIICQTKFFTTPIYIDQKIDKAAIDDTIYSSWASSIITGGYIFNQVELNGTQRTFDFTIVYNHTLTRGLDLSLLQGLISDALFRNQATPLLAPSSSLRLLGTFDYPSPERVNDFDIVSLVLPAFAIFIFQLLFPVILGNLVYEKEYRLREIMKMSGLKTDVYWLVNYLQYMLIYLVALLFMYVVGYALGFKIFTTNDFGTVFFLILLWGNCMLMMSFFFSTLFSNSRTAIVFGYIFIFATGLLSSQLISEYYSGQDTPYGIIFAISLVPSFTLFRGVLTLASAVRFDGPGLRFSHLNDGALGSDLSEVYIYLVVESIVLLLLAIYFEMVIPSGVGITQSPFFCFKPSYWRSRKSNKERDDLQRSKPDEDESEDVREERNFAWDESQKWPVAALDLRKVYPAANGNSEKVAVNNLSMTVRKGECFGLLGPNGSGKSSTINMISGFFLPTSGTVRFFGDLDIRRDVDTIHLMTGVCTQDSLIWEDLTGAEHLLFYGRLRNLSGKALQDEVTYRLQQVNLNKVRNKPAGKYSGGMKRRLCVAMALIGSPRIVLLDEPSTGLDPKARQTLWEVIRKSKEQSSLLLTTHSMEEAEALCERVGIFVNSRMKSIGTPAVLKSRVGKFYKISVTSSVATEQAVHNKIIELCPNAEVFNAPVPGTRSYQILRESIKLADLFSAFSKWTKDESLAIQDYSISSITLEEVFLQIALEELKKNPIQIEQKAKYSKNELVELP